jgi:hypothetical protein
MTQPEISTLLETGSFNFALTEVGEAWVIGENIEKSRHSGIVHSTISGIFRLEN